MTANKVLIGGLRYQVGDGKIVKIWESPWLNDTLNFKPETRKPESCQLTWVSELMGEGGKRWNAELIHSIFSTRDATAIVQTPISQIGVKDRLVW